MERRSTAGFTLIELLIVVVIIGILAVIAIPKYSRMKERAYIAAVTSDMKNLASQQEIYQSNNQTYAASLGILPNFVESDAVVLTITEATGTRWAATDYHQGLSGRQCGFYYGGASAANASPATLPGTVTCDN